MKGGWALASIAVTAAGAPAAEPDLARAFGARETVQQVSLSPDGRRVAIVAPVAGGRRTVVTVGEVGGAPRPVLLSEGGAEQIRWCRWPGNTRLTCGIYAIGGGAGQLIGYTRNVTLNADGSDVPVGKRL